MGCFELFIFVVFTVCILTVISCVAIKNLPVSGYRKPKTGFVNDLDNDIPD